MHEAKNTQRALVRIGYDGTVHKQFRGPEAETRFENEVRVLRYLEHRKCPFVPRLLEANSAELKIVDHQLRLAGRTSNGRESQRAVRWARAIRRAA